MSTPPDVIAIHDQETARLREIVQAAREHTADGHCDSGGVCPGPAALLTVVTAEPAELALLLCVAVSQLARTGWGQEGEPE